MNENNKNFKYIKSEGKVQDIVEGPDEFKGLDAKAQQRLHESHQKIKNELEEQLKGLGL